MSGGPRVLVVGAGIVGAFLAWNLVLGGARVTVLEAGDRGGLATRSSWAWINASWGNAEPYFRLRLKAMEAWRQLGRALPAAAPSWQGGLLWDLPPRALRDFAGQHGAWGYGVRLVDRAEAARIEPALADPPDLAAHVPEEGAVDALVATRALLSDAERLGARVLEQTEVEGLEVRSGGIAGVRTGAEKIPADAVVLSAGEATARLLATVGVPLPLDAPPGLLVRTQPRGPLLNGLVMAPDLHVRQTPEGRLLAGADFGGSDPGEDAQAAAGALLQSLTRLLRGGAGLALEGYTVGRRPTPADGLPVVGPAAGIAGLHIAVMHSGVTLAPLVGRLLAAEIVTGRPEPLLAPYRPGRFADNSG